MTARVLLAGVGALMSAGMLLTTAVASPAGALDPSAVQTVVVGGPSGILLPLQVDRLYPGIGTHARFVVRRGTTWSGGTYAASVTEIEDLERGCNRPEQNAGDVTCGGGVDQGELSDQLMVNTSWTPDVAACATALVPGGLTSMRLARDVPFLAPAALSTDDVCLVVALHLPLAADNLVQSDLVRFSLRIGLDGAALAGLPGGPAAARTPDANPSPSPTATPEETPTSSPSVDESPSAAPIAGVDQAPAQVTPTPTSGSAEPTASPTATAALVPQPRALPFTGGQPLLLAGWAALLIFGGYVLVQAAGQRRAATSRSR